MVVGQNLANFVTLAFKLLPELEKNIANSVLYKSLYPHKVKEQPVVSGSGSTQHFCKRMKKQYLTWGIVLLVLQPSLNISD